MDCLPQTVSHIACGQACTSYHLQSLSSPGFRQELGSLCTVPDTNDSATVPACPITHFRADRFNSGFNEECVTDEAMYREHYYSYLHPGSEVCYVQYQDKDEDAK